MKRAFFRHRTRSGTILVKIFLFIYFCFPNFKCMEFLTLLFIHHTVQLAALYFNNCAFNRKKRQRKINAFPFRTTLKCFQFGSAFIYKFMHFTILASIFVGWCSCMIIYTSIYCCLWKGHKTWKQTPCKKNKCQFRIKLDH